MTSLDTTNSGSYKKNIGVKKAKKLSTLVDMTPMVDLGFLLITFFIFTATMSSPATMDLIVPKDTDDISKQTEVPESGTLTILMGKNNTVFCYEGKLLSDGKNFKATTFQGIRDVIIKKKKAIVANYVTNLKCENEAAAKGRPKSYCNDKDMTVIIKADAEATYQNAVDILDEMTINVVKRFALVKITDQEKLLIAAYLSVAEIK